MHNYATALQFYNLTKKKVDPTSNKYKNHSLENKEVGKVVQKYINKNCSSSTNNDI